MIRTAPKSANPESLLPILRVVRSCRGSENGNDNDSGADGNNAARKSVFILPFVILS